MKNRLAIAVVASIAGMGACTTVGSSPATAPPITEPPTTTSTIVTTTTMIETTTTSDRVAEIQAIFQDLERRRLQAIMDQDEEAFRAVFANEEYEERSMLLMDEVTVLDADEATVVVTKVFVDSAGCIAVAAIVDASRSILGGGVGIESDHVVETKDDLWGFSWVGEGWRCDGPHPFSE